jgi:hypothetical protein
MTMILIEVDDEQADEACDYLVSSLMASPLLTFHVEVMAIPSEVTSE